MQIKDFLNSVCEQIKYKPIRESISEELKNHIEEAIHNGYDTFLSGMALGFDMICTEIVLSFKQKYKDVKMVGVLPCKNQDAKWPESQKARYKKLLNQLDYIKCDNDYYVGPQCQQWMFVIW